MKPDDVQRILAQIFEIFLEQQEIMAAIRQDHFHLIAAFSAERKGFREKLRLCQALPADGVQHSVDVLTDRIQRLSELVRTDQA